MTDPKHITNECYKSIWEKLQKLDYPCVIVVYGPERNYRTTYRGEHGSAFALDRCNNAEEAWRLVDCGYPGWPGDLKVYAITVEVDGYEERIN